MWVWILHHMALIPFAVEGASICIAIDAGPFEGCVSGVAGALTSAT